MAQITFIDPSKLASGQIAYVVIAAHYRDKWVFCRHKRRHTWEIPGGHTEAGENPKAAAHRELWEETGATQAELCPVAAYQVAGSEQWGVLFYGEIRKMENLPEAYEIAELCFLDNLPQELTYPGIQPQLFQKIQSWRSQQTGTEEFWDLYDADRLPTGRMHCRGEPICPGDYHLVVHTWILNSQGELLLTKRSPDKGYPNMWESTGGSALAGEDSLTAALREVREETGIVLQPERGNCLISYQREDAFVDVWLFRQEFDLNTVVLQLGETTDKMHASLDTVRSLSKRGEMVPYPYLDRLLSALTEMV